MMTIFCVRLNVRYDWRVMGPNTHHGLFPISSLCALITHTSETMWHIWTFCISNGHSTIEYIPCVCVRVAWEIWLESYGPRHASVILQYTTLCVYTASPYIHCYLVCNYAWQQNQCTLWLHTTHQTTALLPTPYHFIRAMLTSYTTCCRVFSINCVC